MTTEVIIREERQRSHVIDLISKLSDKKVWRVEIKRYVRSRSGQQHRLYHLWCGEIARDSGHSHDEIHEALKAMFLPPKVVEIHGEAVYVRSSTTKLNVEEFTAFLNQIEAWAATDLGMILPHPEDLMSNEQPRRRTRGGMSGVAHDLDTRDTYEARRGQ